MARKLIFVVLVVGLFVYLRTQRKRNYPFDEVSTPSGRTSFASVMPGTWTYVQQEDMTARSPGLLKRQ